MTDPPLNEWNEEMMMVDGYLWRVVCFVELAEGGLGFGSCRFEFLGDIVE